MRRSHFQRLMEAEFGRAYAPSVAADQVLPGLGVTADTAIADGVDPGVVWTAVCEAMDIPPARRGGRDPKLPPAGGGLGHRARP